MSEEIITKLVLLDERDVDSMFDILNRANLCEGRNFTTHWNWQQVSEELQAGRGIGFKSDRDRLLCFILYRELEEVFEINMLATDPDYYRQGLMNQLLTVWFENYPSNKIWLDVNANNQEALSLYLKFGFIEVGRRKRYYKDGGDAILMQRA